MAERHPGRRAGQTAQAGEAEGGGKTPRQTMAVKMAEEEGNTPAHATHRETLLGPSFPAICSSSHWHEEDSSHLHLSPTLPERAGCVP